MSVISPKKLSNSGSKIENSNVLIALGSSSVLQYIRITKAWP